jgi:uncharacterized protein
MLGRSSTRSPPRRVLVTGASSGIGSAFARALRESDLLLTGRNLERLEDLAAELRGGSGREVRTTVADLSTAEGRRHLVEAAEGFEIDLLVNNAGFGSFGAFLENEPEHEEATVLVNALAPMALARALLPGMLSRAEAEGRRCGLLNVASSLAFTPTPYAAIYAATKAFVLSWTEALAAELARRPIDLLAVCPGPVATHFAKRAGFPGGQLPGAQQPDTVARCALAALGRRTVAFTEPASALAFRPASDLRLLASGGIAAGLDLYRAMRERRAS